MSRGAVTAAAWSRRRHGVLTTASTPAPAPAPAPAAGPFGAAEPAWVVSAADKSKYDQIFLQMGPAGGKVSGGKVAPVLKRPSNAQKA